MQRARTIPRGRSRSADEPMPGVIEPMLAVLAAHLPADEEDYFIEYKWDGVRAIAYCNRGNIVLRSRNNLDITRRYPELHALGRELASRRIILDGEIIAMDEHNRPSFARLQRRMHVNDAKQIERLTREVPAFYVLFDILYRDGRNTMKLPYTDRRELLEGLNLAGSHWQLTPAHRGQGKPMLQAARTSGLEGIVAKRFDGPYLPGKRSDCWLKVKIVHEQELVIGGWIPEGGDRLNRVGALLLGYYGADGNLRYAGNVGTGFDAETHALLTERFRQHARQDSPFAERLPRRNVRFLDPVLVAQVEYRRWPRDGHVQQGAFKGLRTDKRARQITREVATVK
jgi:bifunctional non-homologous end joining protein LigD